MAKKDKAKTTAMPPRRWTIEELSQLPAAKRTAILRAAAKRAARMA